MTTIHLKILDKPGIAWAQGIVAAHHYLYRPIDTRCSVEGYAVHLDTAPGLGPVGCLLFGRPQATRLYPWYGSVKDVHTDRAAVTRWQVLNLARVWLDPRVQSGGESCRPGLVPGFHDRRGVWRPSLASAAIRAAMATVGLDYLLRRSPVYLDEPYQIDWLLSYCDTRLHKGTIYRAAGFELYRTNADGIQTWRVRLPALTAAQHRAIRAQSRRDPRAIRYRAQRAQLALL